LARAEQDMEFDTHPQPFLVLLPPKNKERTNPSAVIPVHPRPSRRITFGSLKKDMTMVYPLHDKAPFKFSFPEKEVYHDSVEKAFHRRLSAARMSERTQKTYVFAVHQLGEHYNKSTDTITQEQLRDYFLHCKNVGQMSCTIRPTKRLRLHTRALRISVPEVVKY